MANREVKRRTLRQKLRDVFRSKSKQIGPEKPVGEGLVEPPQRPDSGVRVNGVGKQNGKPETVDRDSLTQKIIHPNFRRNTGVFRVPSETRRVTTAFGNLRLKEEASGKKFLIFEKGSLADKNLSKRICVEAGERRVRDGFKFVPFVDPSGNAVGVYEVYPNERREFYDKKERTDVVEFKIRRTRTYSEILSDSELLFQLSAISKIVEGKFEVPAVTDILINMLQNGEVNTGDDVQRLSRNIEGVSPEEIAEFVKDANITGFSIQGFIDSLKNIRPTKYPGVFLINTTDAQGNKVPYVLGVNVTIERILDLHKTFFDHVIGSKKVSIVTQSNGKQITLYLAPLKNPKQ